MNQLQYEMIKKVIINGCPACADELCRALDTLVNAHNDLQKKLEKLESKSKPCEENKEDK